MTSVLLSRQKTYFVVTNTCHVFVEKNNIFVTTKLILVAPPANDTIIIQIVISPGNNQNYDLY